MAGERSARDQFGLLILRVLLGALYFTHGFDKLVNALHSPNIIPYAGFFAHYGFQPVGFWARVVLLVEVVGGLCLIAGLFTRIAASLFVVEMIVAAVKVNIPRGWFWTNPGGGYEVPVAFAVIASILVFTEPVRPSLDDAISRRRTAVSPHGRDVSARS
jgi:putative oxidoreductase